MCQIGDIIVIDHYNHNGTVLSKHSFVILNDEAGQIQGLDYDLICNVMSSIKNEEQRKRKLSYPGNFPVVPNDLTLISGNSKNGYIKADQLYYFNKSTISYIVIGRLTEDMLELLIQFIQEELTTVEEIIDNL